MSVLSSLIGVFVGDAEAEKIVPPTGFTVRLTVFTAGAMAFLTVFALALSLAAGRLAERWGDELSNSATLRISAPEGQLAAQTEAALQVLQTTSGVESARALTLQEQQDLLTPWFGADLPLASLPLPQIIEITQARGGFDAAGLRLRLAGEVPGASLDDHAGWRGPLVSAAGALRRLGLLSLLLIAGATGAMITLAANAALAANAQVIAVMRLVGARDDYIASAFVRRFTMRALMGAAVGTLAGAIGLLLMPSASEAGGFLTGLGLQGAQWLLIFVIPIAAAGVAFVATRLAARNTLKGLT